MNRSFFHSFPRRRGEETARDQLAKGERICRSLLDNGIVLTPERFAIPVTDRQGKVVDRLSAVQRRACFTELEPEGLAEHGQTFGPFALVYGQTEIRQIGALPIFYVPLELGHGYLSALATEIFGGLADGQRLVTSLRTIRHHLSNSKRLSLEYRGRKVTFEPDQSDVIKFFIDVLADSAGADLGALSAKMLASTSAYYPTEDPRYNEPLHYYRQREWRLIACNR